MSRASRHDPDPALGAWDVTEADFPVDGTPSTQLRFLLRYAILAPSGHNTQPWRFHVEDGVVEVHADRTRSLSHVDPFDRELTISCGAALETLLIAMQRVGLRGAVDLLPDPGVPHLLARVSPDGRRPDDRADDSLFDAIADRRTSREDFATGEPPRGVAERLVGEAVARGAWFYAVDGPDRRAVADLVAEGDRTQMADRRFRRELAGWIRHNGSRAGDGIRGYGFGIGDLASYLGPSIVRTMDTGRSQATKDRRLALRAPLLAVLGTTTDDTRAWLRCGRALQRILLTAHAAGMGCGYLNSPVEVDALRTRLARTIGIPNGFPQLVLRLGSVAAGSRAQPRRPLGEVVTGASR